MNVFRPILVALLLAISAGTPPTARAADKPGNLQHELLAHAGKIIEQLKAKGFANVGVLKFRVQKGTSRASDTVGTLNLNLAERLEMALILAQRNRDGTALLVLRNASAVAARIPAASHLTAAGREKLLQARYPAAWGQQQLTPDVLLTGLVKISPDLRHITIIVLAFSKADNELRPVAQFTAVTDPSLLMESGESFLVRGAFDSGDEEKVREQIADKAKQVKTAQAKYPLQDAATPVTLDVYYDTYKVPVEIQGGKAWLPEPREGQKVVFVIKRGRSTERLGVVLKVNGENTLFKERLPDAQCRKWILDPGAYSVTVRGFQVDGANANEFRVLSRAESKETEVYYGADVGTISLAVFREKKDRPAPSLKDEAEDEQALLRGVFPKGHALNLAALQHQLRDSGSRGLLAEGNLVAVGVQRVSFVTDPTPIMSVTITYYRP
jgi:hypothetical protein